MNCELSNQAYPVEQPLTTAAAGGSAKNRPKMIETLSHFDWTGAPRRPFVNLHQYVIMREKETGDAVAAARDRRFAIVLSPR